MNRKINYNDLLRDASISVVKKILDHVSKNGFDGEQHLYITFSLKHPDVKISEALKEEFENEITIVLQYEFWDLVVDDHGFSVNLAFDRSNEYIYVPFASLINVNDPSEEFDLNFVPNFSDVIVKPEKQEVTQENNNIISLDVFRRKT